MKKSLLNTKGHWTGEVLLRPEVLSLPMSWTGRRDIFVSENSDLFYDKIPRDFLCAIFYVMAYCSWHRFVICTKRPAYALGWFNWLYCGSSIESKCRDSARKYFNQVKAFNWPAWPLPNVALLTSAETRFRLIERWPALAECPSVVRGLSMEPLLQPIDLNPFLFVPYLPDWLVVGPELGAQARPFNPDWAHNLIAQCRNLGIRIMIKPIADPQPAGLELSDPIWSD